LPAVNHMRTSALITGQKADFVTISNALEQYRQDFGDYPRNSVLPTWNTSSGTNAAPEFLTLATALLGPGPAITQTPTGGYLEIGDGSDGLGFRCQSVVIPGTVNLTASPPTFTPNTPFNNQAIAIAENSPQALLILSPTSSDLYQETIGISGMTLNNGNLPIQLTLAIQPIDTSLTNAVISVPSGKVWGPYISADTFKIAYVPFAKGPPPAGTAWPIGTNGQPVLLDRWGQVIQYFPRYGPASNRLNDSSLSSQFTTPASIQAGPLFGYSQPLSVEAGTGKYAENAIWDFRDGAPFFVTSTAVMGSWKNPVTGNLDAGETWPDPTADTSSPASAGFQPELAIEWMLGDLPTSSTGTFNNAIVPGEKLGYDGPFILISVGPNGPEQLSNGGYCNFAGIASNQLQKTFLTFGNIYNFDHP